MSQFLITMPIDAQRDICVQTLQVDTQNPANKYPVATATPVRMSRGESIAFEVLKGGSIFITEAEPLTTTEKA